LKQLPLILSQVRVPHRKPMFHAVQLAEVEVNTDTGESPGGEDDHCG